MSVRERTREDAHFRILRLLHANPELSQRELSRAVGISTGSTHYILNALIERGLVSLSNFTAADDKRRYAYILTAKGIAEKVRITKWFLARKTKEYEALRLEIQSLSGDLHLGKKEA